jgi:hypothetical protein
MLKINGTTITLTRGDTLRASLEILDAEGNTYTPSSGTGHIYVPSALVNDYKTQWSQYADVISAI